MQLAANKNKAFFHENVHGKSVRMWMGNMKWEREGSKE